MHCRGIAAALLALAPMILSAQKVRTVSGEYTYYPPENLSYESAKAVALSRAQAEILAREFGTVVSSTAQTSVSTDGTGAQSVLLAESSVKGEWLETVGEPEFSRFFDPSSDMLGVRCRVTGRVRAIPENRTENEVRVLCNAPDIRFERSDFRSGDDLFLSFRSSEDGFLAVYLYDGAGSVYRLLPYRNQREASYRVRGGQPYMFFSADNADGTLPWNMVDEYTLTCDRSLELNRLYVVFSPNRFSAAVDSGAVGDGKAPPELGMDAFQRWLGRVRTHDTAMQVKSVDITITK